MPDSDSDSAFEKVLEAVLTSQDRGEANDPNQYLERFPEHSEKLRRFFESSTIVDAHISGAKVVRDTSAANDRFAAKSDDADAVSTTPVQAQALPVLSGFRLLEEIGSGGQGVVYKAEQPGTRLVVALKVIREGALASARERLRFENEIQVASQLRHPNIVAVFESGCDHGREYFAMELAEGSPLGVYLATNTLSPEETVRLFLPICDAVSYAHRQGVIHRDLKPSNIIVDEAGIPHILDFGLAKRVNRPASLDMTQLGSFAGTWYYASPEQVAPDGRGIDVRTDVYSLGVILYEALTDASPYVTQGVSHDQIAFQILESNPIPPSLIRREVNDELETIVRCALQKDPDRRYQSVAALQEDLRRFLGGEAIEAKRDSRWYVLRKTLHRHRRTAAVVAAGVVTLTAFAITLAILYADALAARATTERRAEMVRNGQRFLVERLDELHRISNALAETEDAIPDLPVFQRSRKELRPAPTQRWAEAVQDIPTRIDKALRRPGTTEFANGAEWLASHSGPLDEVEAASRTQRFDFQLHADATVPDWIIASVPMGVGEGAAVCEALIARALLRFHEAWDDDAVRSLDAARSIAQDLSDGRWALHCESGIIARVRGYDAVLWILEAIGTDERRAEPYITWALADPPLPGLKETAILERMKISQVFEAGLKSLKTYGAAYFDIDALERRFPGLGEMVGSALAWSKTGLHPVSVAEAGTALDSFAQEVALWERLTPQEIAEREAVFRRTLGARPTSRLVGALLPNLRPLYERRAHAAATRCAMRLAAQLCRRHFQVGRWPKQLADVVSSAAGLTSVDPVTRLDFGYRGTNDGCLLYSFNDDGVDDGGLAGDWGQVGTDVVLFVAPRPQ